ncbi:MAG: hypothetical protein EOP39_07810 [Rubrivivax sp.]|nr:MAG: hypothetical protein EOP39_07810 [Rubrivivax sp.]
MSLHRSSSWKAAVFVSSCLAASQTLAVDIVSYDISSARPSGEGNWTHVYNGTMVPNGDGTYAYSGGSGTLTDGILPTTHTNNQLLGQNDALSITLHLAQPTIVESIEVWGGARNLNAIPGTIVKWQVTIDGLSIRLTSVGFGPGCDSGLCNDRVFLAGTGLDLVSTSTVTLSRFDSSWQGDYFSIGEITVNAVPEPSSWALALIGVPLILMRGRRFLARSGGSLLRPA